MLRIRKQGSDIMGRWARSLQEAGYRGGEANNQRIRVQTPCSTEEMRALAILRCKSGSELLQNARICFCDEFFLKDRRSNNGFCLFELFAQIRRKLYGLYGISAP